ncbi:MAG: hypothetical protein AB1714_10625 [Acidobacteriota bacterium]
MKTHIALSAAFAFHFVAASLIAADGRWSSGEQPDGVPQARIDAFKTNLENDGFAVTQWGYGRVNIAALVCLGLMASGYGNNAGAPYLTYTYQEGGINVPKEFQLEPYDAVVLIGRTPPPVAYLSYQNYIRKHYYDETGSRILVFTSHGDAMNINTLMRSGEIGTRPFEKDFVVITTGDGGIDARVRSAATQAGIPHSILNTAVVPTSIVEMGVGPASDTFVFLHRLFMAEKGHEDELDEYLQDPGGVVFHLRPKTPPNRPDPFPMPDLRIRGTGKTEMDLMPALQALRRAILEEYQDYRPTELTTKVWLTEGADGIQRRINLLGETRDTSYLRSDYFTLSEDPNEFLIIYGVNHEAAGKATYSNFSIYNKGRELGIAGDHSRNLAGSADDYDLGPYQDMARFLYVGKAARDCNGDPDCLPIKLPDELGACPPVDLNTDLFVAFRAYMEPSTNVGPAWHEILYDQVIKFSLKQ